MRRWTVGSRTWPLESRPTHFVNMGLHYLKDPAYRVSNITSLMRETKVHRFLLAFLPSILHQKPDAMKTYDWALSMLPVMVRFQDCLRHASRKRLLEYKPTKFLLKHARRLSVASVRHDLAAVKRVKVGSSHLVRAPSHPLVHQDHREKALQHH